MFHPRTENQTLSLFLSYLSEPCALREAQPSWLNLMKFTWHDTGDFEERQYFLPPCCCIQIKMNVKIIPVKMEDIAWTWWMVTTASASMGTTERTVNIVSIWKIDQVFKCQGSVWFAAKHEIHMIVARSIYCWWILTQLLSRGLLKRKIRIAK